jgi:hypothetical protein
MNVNHISLQRPPLYFLFYFFEIPEIFSYKTPDLEYVNFATPCITNENHQILVTYLVKENKKIYVHTMNFIAYYFQRCNNFCFLCC